MQLLYQRVMKEVGGLIEAFRYHVEIVADILAGAYKPICLAQVVVIISHQSIQGQIRRGFRHGPAQTHPADVHENAGHQHTWNQNHHQKDRYCAVIPPKKLHFAPPNLFFEKLVKELFQLLDLLRYLPLDAGDLQHVLHQIHVPDELR